MFPAPLMQRGSTKSRLFTVGRQAESPLLIMLDEKKRRSLFIHFHVCIEFSFGIFQFQGLVSSLPLFLGCTSLFREKTRPPSSNVITSSCRVSTSPLASQLPLLASQVASSAVATS